MQHESHRPVALGSQVDEHGVEVPNARAEKVRAKLSRFFFDQRVEPVTPAELAAAHHDGHGHEALHVSRAADVHTELDEAKGHGHQPLGQ